MKLCFPVMRPALRIASSVCLAAALVQGASAQQSPPAAPTLRHSPYLPVNMSQHAKNYYGMMKGIDNLSVRSTASGNLIRFSYRVTDPVAAHLLGEKSATAYLYGEASHALLEIPVMDKIGQLRQTGPLEAGQEYWMVFSNKGCPIKPGERVDVFIGSLHVDGLIVE
ncbi:hypothetical protein [Paraburkholderia aspalathi]|uniref:Uncharacterized protein n=1 Tax=Paraburkholderia aspalathi TaxID=1324617 RepID=A0A1I7A294_9BURK|nr:hypothetical protein [Paraburkholderia aspalathi]SFT69022.1 hypothetical protein SAMN05192563_100336 [Paraburkholderia aspalathi]